MRSPHKLMSYSLTFLFLMFAGQASLTAAVRPQLQPQPAVIPKAEQPMSESARRFLARRDGETVKVWVFFTDKGVFTKEQFRAQANAVTFTERALKRRARVGVDDILFVDLPVVADYVNGVISQGAKLRRVSRWLNAASFEVPLDNLDTIGQLSYVARLVPLAASVRLRASTETVRPDEGGDKTQSLNYGNSLAQLEQIGVPAVHDMGYNGSGVTLAMFDTGFRKTHEAFALHYAEGRVLAEWDFVFDDGNTANEPEDWGNAWNHGTLIWSTAAGYLDGQIYGPAYRANFILCKTEDVRSETPVEEDNWVAALEWVDSLGADVVTSSLSYSDWYTYEDMDGATATTTLAANTAADLGIVVCNSMGNAGPATGTLSAPADALNMLAVGAVDSNGTIAAFSSRGPSYDERTKPEVCARGVSTFCATANSDNSYGTAGGTSLSTPLVAGAACLLVQARSEFTAHMIRDAFMQTADQADAPDNTYGWGIISSVDALGWGTDFTAENRIGVVPLTVQFWDNTPLAVSGWLWNFGDGGTSQAQNPVHDYTVTGIYDVSLTAETEFGEITRTKRNFVIAHADSLTMVPDSAFAGQPVTLTISLVNTQPLEHIVIPFQFGDQFDLSMDSTRLGQRTDYFEDQTWVWWDPVNNTFAVRLRADDGGGAPPLEPGSGPIFHIYFTIDAHALGGLTNPVDSASGVFDVELYTGEVTYPPVVVAGYLGTISVTRGDCNNDGFINVVDLTYLVAYVFGSGDPPVSIQAGDADADLTINLQDITYVVEYLFNGGPPPPTP